MKQKYPMHEIFASCQSVAFQMQSSASVSRSLRSAFAKCASYVLTEMSRMAATSLYLSLSSRTSLKAILHLAGSESIAKFRR